MKICRSKMASAGSVPVFTAPVIVVWAAVILMTEWGLAQLRPIKTDAVPAVAQMGLAGAEGGWYNVGAEATAPPPSGRPFREGERPGSRVLRA